MKSVKNKIDNLAEQAKPGKVYLTLEGVSDYLEIPEEKAKKMLSSGKLVTLERDGKTYASLDSIDAYVQNQNFNNMLIKAGCGLLLFGLVFLLLVLFN